MLLKLDISKAYDKDKSIFLIENLDQKTFSTLNSENGFKISFQHYDS